MRVERGELPISRGDYPTVPEGTTIISAGEWALGKRIFMAVGVSTGIVVAAHNSDTGDGLLGHFSLIAPEGLPDVHVEDEAMHTNAFVEALSMVRRLGPTAETEIWVGGAADYSGVSTEIDLATEGERQYAIRALHQAMLESAIPINHLQTSWSGKQEDLIIQLNSRNGVLMVNHLENRP
ncbi:MAG: hypothetical protein ACHQT5_00175 [Candidatus Saccharimonadales bacterium]|jgi:hypothetical protein